MIRALQSLEQTDGIAILEAELLGVLMICPLLRLDCQTLRPQDFSSPFRAAAFAAIMLERHPSLGSVVSRLEAERSPVPPGRTGWGDTLARVLDMALVDDDAVGPAARAIRAAAIERKRSGRLSVST